MDLVYMYTNSRVLAASKEKDEKKWNLENAPLEDAELEESEGSNAEDESNKDDEEEEGVDVDGNEENEQEASEDDPIFNEEEDINGNTYNLGGESFERGNMYDENMGNNDRDKYDFLPDDNHCGNDEGVPSIVRFVDGSGFLSSNNVLNTNKEDTNVQRAAPIGTTIAKGGTSEANKESHGFGVRVYKFKSVGRIQREG